MNRLNRGLFLLFCLLMGGYSHGQTLLLSESFETDGEGTRYTTNHYLEATPNCNFFERMPASPLDVCFQNNFFSNFQGNFFWGSEDIMRSGTPLPPGQITFPSININGYTGLNVSLYLATANNVTPTNTRWETADSINIQVSINGGAYRTVGRFMGDNAVGGNLIKDNNLNGVADVGEPTVSVNAFAQHTFNFAQTGSTIQVRIDCDQIGGSEELGLDVIELRGTLSCTPPSITCPSTQSLALNSFCQASLADYTSLATVTGNCSPTVTQSPAIGTTVSGSGAMTVSLFATNSALQSATCTFTVNKTTPEAEVRGNSTVIVDGDPTPSITDHTDFASVLTCTGTIVRTFTINNLTGTFGRTLNVGSVTVGGTNASDFTVTAQPATTVAVGGSTTFQVTFNPSADGLRSATLSFTTDDCDENPYNFSIQGTGNADVVDPTITCPATQTLVLNGSCQATLPDYTGLATGVTDNCPTSPTIGQSPAAGSLQSGVGPLTVSLFATDGSLNSNTCTFTVNKTSPEMDVTGNGTSIVDGDVTPSLTDHTDFGTVTIGGNLVRTYTISNSGTANLTLASGSITVSGGQAAEFVVGGITLPATVPPAGNITFTVTFSPTATGLRSTTLNIANNDCDENPYNYLIQGTGQLSLPEINVKGNTVTIVDGDITPTTTDHTDFGSVATCTGTLSRTFTIENTGGQPLNLGTVTMSGTNAADFTVTVQPPATIAAGSSGTFTVVVDPGANGLRTATVNIPSNDADENPYDFAVQGTGTADVTNPTITCPSNISTTAAPSLCAAPVVYVAPVGSDNCPSPSTTQTSGLASGANFPVGVTTNVFRVTDGSGNTATCSFTVTVTDNQAPTMGNLACQLSNAAGTAYNDGWQTGDNDGAGFGAWTLNASTGNTAQAGFFAGSSTLNGAGTDTNGDQDINSTGRALGMYANTSQATQATRPIIGDLPVGRRLTIEFDNGFVDNGQIVGFQLQNSAGNSLGEVRFRGNQATYEIVDLLGITPFTSIPFTDEGIIIEVVPTIAGQTNIRLTRKVNGATQALNMSHFPGGGNQLISRIMVFNSNAGTGASKDLFVNNMQVCTASLGCPSNIVTNTGPGVCTAVVTYNQVVASDNCSQSLPVTRTAGLASGATYPLGVTTNTFQATDLSANTATCSFTVTVTDVAPPTAVCQNITLSVNGGGTATTTASAVNNGSSDNCSVSTVTLSPTTFNCTNIPSATATLTVTDGSGNTATCTSNVTVQDLILPAITCPTNISTNTAPGTCAATVSYATPVGTDNCSGPSTTQTAGLGTGASFPLGVTTNTFRVTDGSGNTATCSFTVTVTDNILPTITCPSNIGANTAPGTCAATVTYTAPVGADNCSGPVTAQTSGLASGASFPLGVTTNTFRVTDGSGNTATCSFTVTVTDNILPTITCPSNISANTAPGTCAATVTFSAPVGADNCSGPVTVQTSGLASGASFPGGVTTNTFRVTDGSGNTATCSFTVTISDNILPTITCPSTINVNTAPGTCAATVSYSTPVGADNCSGSTTSQTSGLASGSSFPLGSTQNIFRVTDASGNTATCSFFVSVTDNILPTITCPSNISTNTAPGTCAATVTYTAPLGSDNCSGPLTTQTAGLASGASYPLGVTTNTYQVTDGSGNTATCSFTVTVTDNILPTITCPSNISTNTVPGTCAATVTYTAPVGSDNCTGQSTVQTTGLASGSSYPLGVTTNTFRVTDGSGNTATCAFTVTVIDNILPTITCPSNINTNPAPGTCAATVTYSTPVGLDNCSGPVTVQTAGLASGASFPGGVTTNTFRVTDGSGNTATCSFTVTVTDNILPVIACPSNINANTAPGTCAATVTYSTPVGTDNCASPVTVQTAGLASGASFPLGVTTNTFRVTDGSGNTATCSFTVTVTDNILPTITCPSNISANTAPGTCAATVTFSTPVGADNCSGPVTVQTTGLASGSSFTLGVTTNTFRVTDGSGNTATCSFTVTVIDNILPTITCPSNISTNTAPGTCAATVTFTAPVGADNCSGPVTVQIAGLASGASYPTGVTTNTFRVTDGSANTATCSFTVTVIDNILPAITCPSNISTNTAPGTCAATVSYSAPVGTDNCSGASTTQTAGLASGASYPLGLTTNTFRVTDASGNTATCSFTVTVIDNILPTITCPSNISTNTAPGTCAAIVSYGAPTGTDNCSGASTAQTAGLASGASFPLGVTTNTFRVTDGSGNTATCAFTVTVTDNILPTITCPSNISTNTAPGTCAATVSYSAPTGTDNCSGATTAQTAGLASGASFPLGVTTNTFRVTDGSGNTATCAFTVTVTDNILPLITCPSNISTNTAPGTCAATVTYSAPLGTDNCSGASTAQTAGLGSGASYPLGVTTNTFRVTDGSGNTATCSFTVTVTDNILPVITCPSNVNTTTAPGTCAATVTYTAPTGTDNCSGASTVQTTGLASGSSFPLGVTTNTFRVTDGSGNTATCSFSVTVTDNILPVITCPSNISTNTAPGTCAATVTYSAPTGTDNCSGASTTQTAGLSSGASFPLGVTTNTFRVMDGSGNTATCSFTVTVTDNILPSINCPANISTNTAPGTCAATVTFAAPTGTDNCTGSTTTQTAGLPSGSSFPLGVTTNTFRVTDGSGNTATCSFTVTVTDNILPSITCPANISTNTAPGTCSATVSYATPTGTDNCSGASTVQVGGLASGASYPLGVTTNTYRVTDGSGNSATCSFTVTVTDNILPVITCPANISTNTALGTCNAVVSYSTPTGTDNCSGATTTQTAGLASGSAFPTGVTTNTFRVTDGGGSTATCSFTVTVADNTPPTAICQNVTVSLDAGGQGNTTASAVNNGSTDGCGIASLSLSPSTFNCTTMGSNTVVLTVTDLSGNTGTCAANAAVIDPIMPSVTCPANITAPADSSICGAVVSWLAAQASDNCGISSVTSSHLPGVFPVGTTVVTYTATDVNSNTTTCSFNIVVQAAPLQAVILDSLFGCGYHLACAGDSNARVEVYVSGGCEPYTYSWTSGSTTSIASNLPAGLILVTVTDAVGSTAGASLIISAPSSMGFGLFGDTLVCDGSSDGELSAFVFGGHNCVDYNYLWSTGSDSSTIFGLTAGTYSITVTDEGGCQVSGTYNIALGQLPVLDLGADTTTCPGVPLLFEAPPIYSSYLWNDGSDNSTILMTSSGTYSCTVWTSEGCSDMDSVNLSYYVLDTNIITPLGSLNLCVGDSVTLVGDSSTTNWNWSNGSSTQTIVVTGPGGSYNLSAVDTNGCTVTDTIIVNYTPFNDPFPVIVPGPIANLCDGGSLVLDVQSGYFSYLWSTGSNTQTTTVTAAGFYDVTVSNGYGCTAASQAVQVVMVPLPSPSVTYNSGVLSTSSFVSYQWLLGGSPITGAIAQTYVPLVAGWYSVVVTDANNCTGTSDSLYVNPVGIDDQVESFAGLSLYPNPSFGIVHLQSLHPIDWPVTVEIWDMYGHKVRQYDMNHLLDKATFDLSELAAAAYTIRVTAYRQQKTLQTVLRFVKE